MLEPGMSKLRLAIYTRQWPLQPEQRAHLSFNIFVRHQFIIGMTKKQQECYAILISSYIQCCSVNAPYNRMSMQTIDTNSCHERESAKQERRGGEREFLIIFVFVYSNSTGICKRLIEFPTQLHNSEILILLNFVMCLPQIPTV